MGIPSEMRNLWIENRKNSILIASPAEEQKLMRSKKCVEEGVRAGLKASLVGCVVSTAATLALVRYNPWAKRNLNYTAQALIISGASIASYFVTVDKTILECARKNSMLNAMALHDKTA